MKSKPIDSACLIQETKSMELKGYFPMTSMSEVETAEEFVLLQYFHLNKADQLSKNPSKNTLYVFFK